MRIESCHPGVIALYFAAMLAFTGWFQQPVFLALSLGTAVVVTGFLFRDGLWKRLGWTATAGGVVFLWAALFCRFGDTVLWGELWGNPVTLEGLVYSATLWVRVTAALLWCGCLFRLVPVDKIVGLLGRVAPHLSLYITILLRLAPRMGCRRPGDSGDPDLLRSEKRPAGGAAAGEHGADLGTGQPGGGRPLHDLPGLLPPAQDQLRLPLDGPWGPGATHR